MTASTTRAPVAIADLATMKARSQPIVMVTAYDYPSARVAEHAGVDVVLVGDSAATTLLGYAFTREVGIEEMLMLVRAVRRGLVTPLLVGDMPFGSYEASDAHAVASARRFIDAGCAAVKIEGAGATLDRVRALVAAGIPVMGHIGLTPQGVSESSGYHARGRTAGEAVAIVKDAISLERAGCFAIVIEAIAAPVADVVTSVIRVPTIGIGAGTSPDGQVLVFHDLLGLTESHQARFVKRYAEIGSEMVAAVEAFASEVRARLYPAPEHTYGMPEDELVQFRAQIAGLRRD